ncbi:LLM class flavin-dependent oxidoreductase [Streptomyces asiaticus]|uniref:LLM class flavin-dependent oxidoreductase n=1 Tax=Streptomyces asiaticus TaxID=114695 RepID=UPI0035563FD2
MRGRQVPQSTADRPVRNTDRRIEWRCNNLPRGRARARTRTCSWTCAAAVPLRRGDDGAVPRPDLGGLGRELESLGYSTLFVPDHLDEGYGPITAMAMAAAATTTLRVAPAVLAADFRHPAVLARELASIDQLSQGRLEVGVGCRIPECVTTGVPGSRWPHPASASTG